MTMSKEDHRKSAEELLDLGQRQLEQVIGNTVRSHDGLMRDLGATQALLIAAQVHATLAQGE